MPLRLTPDPAGLFAQAIALLRSGDPGAARLLPELERFADYGAGWLALGVFLQQAGKHDAALVALARAAPRDAALAHRIGQCLNSLGRRAAAIESFRRAVAIDAGFAEGWYSLGLACQDDGDHQACVAAYRAALRARPDFHEAAFNLGVALQEAGRLQEATPAYGTALRLRPQSLARIAQALSSGRAGTLWLDPAQMRRDLNGAPAPACGSAPNP